LSAMQKNTHEVENSISHEPIAFEVTSEYDKHGLREIEEYIEGENTDNKLSAARYIVFDLTVTASARRYIGSDINIEVIANRAVQFIAVNIDLPKPTKKPRSVLRNQCNSYPLLNIGSTCPPSARRCGEILP